MPTVAWSLSVPAGQTASPSLAPYDRFGGKGGAIKVRATVIAAAANLVQETIMIGGETIEVNAPVAAERAVGAGPDVFTRAASGIGGAGDPITIIYRNTDAAARVVSGWMEIENVL
jgi:hypothetical protein